MRRWTSLRRRGQICLADTEATLFRQHVRAAALSTSTPRHRRHIPVRGTGDSIKTLSGPKITFSHQWNLDKESIVRPARIVDTLNKVEDEINKTDHERKDMLHSKERISTHSTAWKEYKEEVRFVVTSDEGDLDTEQKTFREELFKAYKDHKTFAFIHRRFIDRYLVSAGYDVESALKRVADMRYPAEWYVDARATQRDIHLHIGPTNSGKTYNALKRLEEADSGFYAGPLRLLAHEVYSRFQAKGLACDLVTGDDVRHSTDEDTQKIAATVEMVDTGRPVEVAVIDEIQMMADADRGWAWTRAFLGAVAKEVHLCGENRVLPLVQELTASMGDNLIVHEYQRLNPLKCMRTSLEGDLSRLRKGDAIVSFSILGIHAMKKAIESTTGKRVAIVYGSLPPETRAQQAALFNEPDNDYDYLVASDAIGMGLNLNIKRIIFESVWKFDGFTQVQLSVPQIKQIAGRAGRYRTARQAKDDESKLDDGKKRDLSVGLVTTLNAEDLQIVRAGLKADAPPITTAGIFPPGDFVEDLAARLPADTPHEYVLTTLAEAAAVHPRYSMCMIRDQLRKSRVIESVRGLTTTDRHIFTMMPATYRHDFVDKGDELVKDLAQRVADRVPTTVADVKTIPLELLEEPLRPDRACLESLEFLHQSLILFMWLSYRLTSVFKSQQMTAHAKEMVEQKINAYLEKYTSSKQTRISGAHRLGSSDVGLDSEGSRRLELGSRKPAIKTRSALPSSWTRARSNDRGSILEPQAEASVSEQNVQI